MPYTTSSLALAVLWWRYADRCQRLARASGRIFSFAIGAMAVPHFFWAFALIAVVVVGSAHALTLSISALLGRRGKCDGIVSGLLTAAMGTTLAVAAVTGFPYGNWWLAVHISVAVGVGMASIGAVAALAVPGGRPRGC